jgi:hypothetical protein
MDGGDVRDRDRSPRALDNALAMHAEGGTA